MSIQLQIAIPLFVTFAALVGIAVWRKYLKPEVFVLGLMALCIGITMTISHTNLSTETQEEKKEGSIDSQSVSLMLANQYMLQTRYEDASEILRDLQNTAGGEQVVLTASARCQMLQGNYALAAKLYQQAGVTGEELDLALALSGTNRYGDDATIHYLESMGINPDDYQLTAGAAGSADHADAVALIFDKLQADLKVLVESNGEQIAQAVEAAAAICSGFGDYISGMEGVDLSSDISKLDKYIGKVPALSQNPHIRLARLKGYVLTGDYGRIAKMANRYITPQELVILTQLLVDGTIDTSDFGGDYANVDVDRYRDVLEACESALESNEGDLTNSQYKTYKGKIGQLREQIKSPVKFTLRVDLKKEADNGPAEMRSKTYLALAKLENADGNSDDASRYISQAIGTAGDSDDQNYSIPMNQMASIIQGTAESDEIKNVAEYVDTALDHSLPLDVKVSQISDQEENVLQDQMTNDVTQSKATINIGVINTDQFEVVKARVQIDSRFDTIEELKEHLLIYDCGSQITDFQLEKLEFQSSNIVLLCDVSGSMSDSVDSLRNAIVAFAEEMQDGEVVCVVGFDDRIDFVHEFSGDPETVKGYADSVYAGGGTALFDAVIYCGDLFNYDINANNVIIAMTDGQDGDPASNTEMYNQIGAMVADKDITLYTMGLGYDVNTEYLELMAQCGNGTYLYVDEQEDLQEFYNFIHGQLANQYILTYTAKNKTLNERKLELSVEDELGGAEKIYYLVEPEITDEGADAYDPYTVVDTELTVHGLTTKFLYKSSQDQTVKLRGDGFDQGDDVTVRLVGNVKYNLDVQWIDKTTYQITIPSGVATGVYDLVLCIRGESLTLEDELTIAVPGDMKNFRFGSYSFTALDSYINDDGDTVLTGNVIMNGWLYFKGDIIVNQDYTDTAKAWITDNSGCYIPYTDQMATGLAQTLADSGISISFNKLGTFCIYDRQYTPEDYEDFPVDDIAFDTHVNACLIMMEDFGVAIYPDMLRLQGVSFEYNLPFQKQLMRNLNIGGTEKVKLDSDVLLTATKVAILGSLDYSGEEMQFTMVSLPLTLNKLKVDIDTLRNDYLIEAAVKFKAVKKMDTVGFSFEIKDGKFEAIGIETGGDLEVTMLTNPVPVSFKDFGFKLSGFSDREPNDNLLEIIYGTQINFNFTVNIASLNKYLPKIAEVIDDKNVAIASLENCNLSIKFKNFRIAFDADLKLCTVLDVGKVHIALGTFSYTNALIGYYDVDQYGLQAALTLDIGWDTPKLDMGMDGTAEVTIGYPYTGLWLNGNVDFDVGWWIIKKEFDVSGDILAGLYKNSSDNLQFSIIVRGTNNSGKYSGFHLYVTRATGFDIYSY